MDRIKEVNREDNERLFKENITLRKRIASDKTYIDKLNKQIDVVKSRCSIYEKRIEELEQKLKYKSDFIDYLMLELSKYQDHITLSFNRKEK